VAGYLWLVLCLASPYLHRTLCAAMSEAPLLAAIAATAWAADRALQSVRQSGGRPERRALAWFAAVGLCAGIAGAAKLNGLVVAGAGAALAAAAWWAHGRQLNSNGLRWLFTAELLVVGGATVVFVAVNPYLYADPIGRTERMFQHRLTEMQQQVSDNPGQEMPAGCKGAQVLIHYVFQHDAPIPSPTLLPVYLTLCAAGVAAACHGGVRWLGGKSTEPTALVLCVMWPIVSAPTVLTPLVWERYFLLPVVGSMVFVALGAGWLASLVPGAERPAKGTSKAN
jgi:hypothetical protein